MRTASLRAMDLAQPMSLPLAFQPGISFQVAHCILNTIPMPQSVDESTQTSGSTKCLGLRERAMQGLPRAVCQIWRFFVTGLGTQCHIWSLGKFERNVDREGR